MVQCRQAIALDGVLVLCSGLPASYPDVLYRLQKQRRPRHDGELWPQASDDLVGRRFPFIERLERDENAARIGRRAAAATGKSQHGVDGGVLFDYRGESLNFSL